MYFNILEAISKNGVASSWRANRKDDHVLVLIKTVDVNPSQNVTDLKPKRSSCTNLLSLKSFRPKVSSKEIIS